MYPRDTPTILAEPDWPDPVKLSHKKMTFEGGHVDFLLYAPNSVAGSVADAVQFSLADSEFLTHNLGTLE